jgi:hypothetical protein
VYYKGMHVANPNFGQRSIDGLITLHIQREIDKSVHADCMVHGLTADGVFGWFQTKPTKRDHSIALRIRILGDWYFHCVACQAIDLDATLVRVRKGADS